MSVRWTLVIALAATAIAPLDAHAQPMVEYVVEEGDDCGSIARRLYGTSRRYDLIHQHNPDLGPMPHDLVAGTTLQLPQVRVRSGAEATVTSVRRRVQSQPPQQGEWSAARVGEELERGARVSTGERSSTDLTFRESAVAHVREQTLVIVYGGDVRRAAREEGARAVLREGSMLSRISALSGNPSLEVETPAAQATLNTGESSVDVASDGETRVAVHSGEAATVRGRDGRGAVRVQRGMGTRVVRGRAPTRPRPLPTAPAFEASGPRRFLALAGHGGSVHGRWEAVPDAARYRVELARREDGREVLVATEVGPDVRSIELHRLPPSTYYLRVSTIDAEGFEGRPSEPTELTVLGVRVAPPGRSPRPLSPPDPFGLDSLDSGLGELDFESNPDAVPTVPRFSRIVPPDGIRCGSDTVLREPGRRELSCESDDGRLGTLVVDVTDVAVRAEGEDGAPASIPRRGEGTVRLIVDGLDDASGLSVRSPSAVTVEGVEAHGGVLTARLSSAGGLGDAATLEVVASDEVIGAAEVAVRGEGESAPVAPAEPSEPSYLAVQETFGLAAFPSSVGLVDERRRGSGMHLAATLVSAEEGDARTQVRLTAGLRAALLDDRLRVDVAVPLDLRGDGERLARRGSRDVYAALSSLVLDEDAIGLAAEVGLWMPTAGQEGLDRWRLRAAVDFSFRAVDDRLVIRTRQAGLFDLRDAGSALWASAYGVDFRIVGPLTAGAELGLVLGEEGGAFQAAGTAGLAVGIDFEIVVVSLGGRVGFGDHALVGLGAGTLSVRGTYDFGGAR